MALILVRLRLLVVPISTLCECYGARIFISIFFGTVHLITLFSRFEDVTDAEECAGIQKSYMPTCCPLQLSTIARENACGWCPNGVSDVQAQVELPFSTESVTCAALMFG